MTWIVLGQTVLIVLVLVLHLRSQRLLDKLVYDVTTIGRMVAEVKRQTAMSDDPR
jgi:hypothetical protein